MYEREVRMKATKERGNIPSKGMSGRDLEVGDGRSEALKKRHQEVAMLIRYVVRSVSRSLFAILCVGSQMDLIVSWS